MSGELRILQEEVFLLEASASEIYKKHYSKKVKEDDFNEIVKADPTSIVDVRTSEIKKVGGYSKWLLELYMKRRFRIEDVYKAKEYLELYVKHMRDIPVKDRTINRLKSIADLFELVKDFRGAQTRRDKKRAVEKGEKEIDKFYEDDKWLVIIPETKDASCFYGKGTEWCTASLGRNYFDEYNNMGALFIAINKSDQQAYEEGKTQIADIDKYQFHFFSWQFADKHDNTYPDAYYPDINMPDSIIKRIQEESVEMAVDKLKEEFDNVHLQGDNLSFESESIPRMIRDLRDDSFTAYSVHNQMESYLKVSFKDYEDEIRDIVEGLVEKSGKEENIDSDIFEYLESYDGEVDEIVLFSDELETFYNEIVAELLNNEKRHYLDMYLEYQEESNASVDILDDGKGKESIRYGISFDNDEGIKMLFALVENMDVDILFGDKSSSSRFDSNIDGTIELPSNIEDIASQNIAESNGEYIKDAVEYKADEFFKKYR